MSSPYKEWIEDRQVEALADISKIAILYDKLKERRYTEEDIDATFYEVMKILEKGDWV